MAVTISFEFVTWIPGTLRPGIRLIRVATGKLSDESGIPGPRVLKQSLSGTARPGNLLLSATL